ncbi:C1 [Wild vitis virus 1]|uniref:Replication-associated protein n=1 Tax=Wild vitis virus 1 TaxID=2025352 RepID=A0A223FPN2_9GEMI|nr:C1 [Wild vitis virus 1]AST09936.1 C1 [Wild vitis virus 1]
MTSFNLRSKSFFLTYPQCPVIKEFALDFFKSKFSDRLEYIRIGKERHLDGEPHLHALLIFFRRQTIRNSKHFDITVSSNSYHPNITKPRDVEDVYNYVGKDGDTTESGTKPNRTGSGHRNREADFGEYLRSATSKHEFLELVRNNYPYQYAIHLQRLEYAADKTWPPTPSVHASQFNTFNHMPPEVDHWIKTELYMVRKDTAREHRCLANCRFLEIESETVHQIIDDKIDDAIATFVENQYRSDNELDVAGGEGPQEEHCD